MSKNFLLSCAALLAIVTSDAMACDCISRSLAQQVYNSDIVLVASVTKSSTEFVEIKSIEILKGKVDKPLSVRTGSSNCDTFHGGIPPAVGSTYLLFLVKEKEHFLTSMCHGSGSLESKPVQADLSDLRRLIAQAIPADRGEKRPSR